MRSPTATGTWLVEGVLNKLPHYNGAGRSVWVRAVVAVVELLNDYRSSDPMRACNNAWVSWLTKMLVAYGEHDAARTALAETLLNHVDMSEYYLKTYLPCFATIDDYFASQFPPDVKQDLIDCLDENVESNRQLLQYLE